MSLRSAEVDTLYIGAGKEAILKTKFSQPRETGLTGIQPLPVDYATIWEYSNSNAFHGRCLQIKSDAFCGYGFEGSPRSLDYLEEITREDTLTQFFQKTAYDYFCFGNSFWEFFMKNSKPSEMYHVPANTCFVNRDYSITQITEKEVRFGRFGGNEPSQMAHIKRYTPMSSFYGAPEWIFALESLRLDKNLKLYLSNYFDNNALPDMLIFLTGGKFAPAAETKIGEALSQNKGVGNSHKSILVSTPSEKAKITPLTLTPDLNKFSLDTPYARTREEVIAAHGVPPRLLSIVTAGQLGGGNEETAQMLSFVDFTLSPAQTVFEELINKKILKPAGLPEDFSFRKPDWYRAAKQAEEAEEAEEEKQGPRTADEIRKAWEEMIFEC